MMSGKGSERNMYKLGESIGRAQSRSGGRRWKGILFRVVITLLVSLVSSACSRPKITLDFELPSSLHAAYNISCYVSSSKGGGRWIETAIMLQNGKGRINLPMDQPSVIELKAGQTSVFIYAERGDKIKISGDSADPFNWKIGGNEINEEWSSWRKEYAGMLSSHQSGPVNEAVKKYVSKNPSDPLSVLLLLYEYNRRYDNEGFLKLWKSLKGEAAKEKWITISGRSDLYTNRPIEPASAKKKHKIIVKSLLNGTDTIVTGKKPVVILFWRNQDKDRDKMIDSLRSLRRHNPDSSSFIIADICFDPDSLSWVSPLGRDSLEHVIRGWNPIGEADSTMQSLGIERTPVMIKL